jgi:hypothetical protein
VDEASVAGKKAHDAANLVSKNVSPFAVLRAFFGIVWRRRSRIVGVLVRLPLFRVLPFFF